MSLSKWANVNPYVANRVSRILDVADRYGGRYTVTSGYRNIWQQWQLRSDPRGLPVADPGCSQHQYGLAMDVKFDDPWWQNWYLRAARTLGLITIKDDPVHVQAFDGSNFRRAVSEMGLCPHPDYVTRLPVRNNFTTGGSFCSLSQGPWPGFRCAQWSPTPTRLLE